MEIDLRSDTVTRPSAEMLTAMMHAKVGDDVYSEDPTVNALQDFLATMFGMDEALFFPSGTMANQTALKLHTNPGEQVICESYAHIFNYEGGGASFNSGVSCKLIAGDRGMFTADQAKAAINPPDFYHSPLTRLIAVENTTNKGGGACWDISELERLRTLTHTHGLGFHLDGARLWNAIVAKNQSPKVFGALFDTISVCLSKGLGCPMGSVLIGRSDIMKNAIRVRKLLGGGMRQVGFAAAAGLYALEHNMEALKADNLKAHQLSACLANCSYVKQVQPVETNIVIFELKPHLDVSYFIKILQDNAIKISAMGPTKLRMVTHLNYTSDMHAKVIEILENLKF